MLEFILLSCFGSDVFEEFNIAEIELFVSPEIKQMDDDWTQQGEKSVKNFRMVKAH